MAINDGGPANAIPGCWYLQPARPVGGAPPDRPMCIEKPVPGMSKLEVYALHAMQGFCAQTDETENAQSSWEGRTIKPDIRKSFATAAFDMAAEMVAEYERRMKEPAPKEEAVQP